MSNFPTPNITCYDPSTLQVRGYASQPGMLYEFLLRASASDGANVTCGSVSSGNSTLRVTAASSVWLAWVGDTEYNMSAGDSAHDFSFKGPDPHNGLVSTLSSLPKTYQEERGAHVADVHAVLGKFALSLGAPSADALQTPTDQLLGSYAVDTGNPYLEWLTFNYGRYMLFSSARGVLPANLQGKWAFDNGAPWSGGECILLSLGGLDGF
jgi:alpha-L-fucosidase 2